MSNDCFVWMYILIIIVFQCLACNRKHDPIRVKKKIKLVNIFMPVKSFSNLYHDFIVLKVILFKYIGLFFILYIIYIFHFVLKKTYNHE